MENVLDKLELGNVKQLRKNLLVVSATAIAVSQFLQHQLGINFY